MGWIAVDFDATLFEWGEGTSNPGDVLRVGKPIPKMVERIKKHLAEGEEVRIFTARVGPGTVAECLEAFKGRGQFPAVRWQAYAPNVVEAWMTYQTQIISDACLEALGVVLPITAVKDFYMYKLYDDRACQVIPNTGELVEEALIEALAVRVPEVVEGQSER